jgi:O-antigen ligase
MLILIMVVLDLGPRWTWIAFGVVMAATLQAILGLYEFFGGSGAPHLWIANYRYFRAFGTFGQPNPFSAFMGLTLPLSFGLAWGHLLKSFHAWRTTRSQWLRPGIVGLFYAGCGVLLLGGLVASWGRGAWMGFGAAAIVMVFFAPRRWWQGAVLLITGGVVVLLLWMLGYVPFSVQQRVNTTLTEFTGFGDMRAMPINNDNFAIVERLAHWQAATYMANAHPWIGVGLGNYEAVYPAYRIPSWPHPLGHAHNDYLNTLAETGIIGLTGYLLSWAAIVYWTWRALQQPDLILRGLALGLLGTWTHLAIHSLVDKLYVNNLFLHVGVLLGLLALAHSQQQVRE